MGFDTKNTYGNLGSVVCLDMKIKIKRTYMAPNLLILNNDIGAYSLVWNKL